MLYYNLAKTEGITITQKFLVTGHTQMEVDNIHSVLERKWKQKEVYIPAQYVEMMRTKYDVKYLDFTFFQNYTSGPVQSIRPGLKTEDPLVTDLRALTYLPRGEIMQR